MDLPTPPALHSMEQLVTEPMERLVTELKRGKHGRPADEEQALKVPPEIKLLAIRLIDTLEDDWLMTGGWLVMRQWHTPSDFSVVIARVAEETQVYEAMEQR